MKSRIRLDKNWELRKAGEPESEWMPIRSMPAQVAEILLEKKLLPEEVKLGWCQEAQWVAKCEWEYRCRFRRPSGKRHRLVCKGLDTLATIYLNGKKIGEHDDLYIPEVIEITEECEEENTLLIRFHSVIKQLEKETLPAHLQGVVLKSKLIRKPIHDFPLKNGPQESNYQGAVPGFTPVGIYDDVILETWEDMEITGDDIRAECEEDTGRILFEVEGSSDNCEEVIVRASVFYEENLVGEAFAEAERKEGHFRAKGSVEIERPYLWYPIGFGEQPLYRVEICAGRQADGLADGLESEDRLVKEVGFRKIEVPEPLAFVINGKKVRLWGGSMDPMQGITHCYQRDRAERIFQMAANANMNTLRIWGEGIPLPDEFYEEADRRGILIWQEFFMGYGAYPDDEAYGEKCVREAEFLIRRIRHHASLLMWCGGNETFLGAELMGVYPYGDWIVKKAFPQLLERLDPKRYYHVNSPYGGVWSNDPREGDCHTYECEWEYPYQAYPNLISESFRTAPPARRSLERIIKGGLWPEDYDTRVTKPGQRIMPANWLQRSHLMANGERLTGNYWEYYDAADVDDLLYRFGASYGAKIKKIGEQVRIGSRNPEREKRSDMTGLPIGAPAGNIGRSKGYIVCKLLDTWPKVFCAVIDYFQEGYIPYYATKRVLEPLMVCFARDDNIRLYAVNDSAKDFEGTVKMGLYDLKREAFAGRELLDVSVGQGDCAKVTDLDGYPFFSTNCVLYARLMDRSGKDVYTCIDYVDIERHLPFQEPELTAEIHGDVLSVSALHFARCVEITGECDGDLFGWLFEDNYFDLMPGTVKRVRILGRHRRGTIRVKAQYSEKICEVTYGGQDL